MNGCNALQKTNIAPSQKETSIPTIHFQVRLLLVSGRVILTEMMDYSYYAPLPGMWHSEIAQNSMELIWKSILFW